MSEGRHLSTDGAAALGALVVLDGAPAVVDWTLAYECDRCKTMTRVYDAPEAQRAIDRKGMCQECAR